MGEEMQERKEKQSPQESSGSFQHFTKEKKMEIAHMFKQMHMNQSGSSSPDPNEIAGPFTEEDRSFW